MMLLAAARFLSPLEGGAGGIVETAASIALGVLSLAVVLSLIRLARGPSLPDRVVALDAIATLLVGILVLEGLAAARPQLVQVAAVLALINFLGTIAFASYIQGKPRHD